LWFLSTNQASGRDNKFQYAKTLPSKPFFTNHSFNLPYTFVAI